MSTDSDIKKGPSKVECWIHKTSLNPQSVHKSCALGYNLFLLISVVWPGNNNNDNNNNNNDNNNKNNNNNNNNNNSKITKKIMKY